MPSTQLDYVNQRCPRSEDGKATACFPSRLENLCQNIITSNHADQIRILPLADEEKHVILRMPLNLIDECISEMSENKLRSEKEVKDILQQYPPNNNNSCQPGGKYDGAVCTTKQAREALIINKDMQERDFDEIFRYTVDLDEENEEIVMIIPTKFWESSWITW